MARAAPDPRPMQRALEVARRGLGRVAPNPPVGAVLVCADGSAEGWHQAYGEAHAEVICLEMARRAGIDSAGADLYVTLEPCGHQGKTPPCVDSIIAAGIGRVIVAVDDPNPVTSGVGYQKLDAAGIDVVRDFMAKEGRYLAAPYLCRIRNGRPLVTSKWAMTADGKIACVGGDSRWITSALTRAATREARGQIDAILVGVETVISDDPQLTCRVDDQSDPVRVVIDPNCRTPLQASLLKQPGGALIYCQQEQLEGEPASALRSAGAQLTGLPLDENRMPLKLLLEDLAGRGIQHLLVEGGSETHGRFIDAGMLDRVQILIAPKLVGGREAPGPTGGDGISKMQQAIELQQPQWRESGDDRVLEAAITAEGLGEVSL